MKCFIFTGGDLVCKDRVSYFPKKGDLIIAADSGVDNFSNIIENAYPDIIVGDMDSGDFDKIKRDFPKSEYIKLPCEKDDTDTAFAVSLALERGAKEIYIVGGIGSRLDHTIANAYILKNIYNRGGYGVLDNGKNTVFYLENGEMVLEKSYCKHKYVSVIPLEETISGVTLKGFKYPLEKREISMEKAFFSVSNEMINDFCVIQIQKGKALVIQSDD